MTPRTPVAATVRRALLGASAILVAVLLSACTVDGAATRSALQVEIDRYLALQEEAYGDARNEIVWARLLGNHLAESMIFLSETDAALDETRSPTQPFATPYQAQLVLMPQIEDLPAIRPFSYGFVVAAGSSDDESVHARHAVLVFRDAAAADTAADALADALVDSDYTDYRPTRVAALPATSVVVRSGPADRASGAASTVAFTPVGRSLVVTRAESTDVAWTSRITVSAYRAQKALLDVRSPEPTDRAADPARMITGTITMPDNQIDMMRGAVYGPRAAALFHHDQQAALRAIRAAGIDLFAWNRSDAYRTADADRTGAWIDFLSDEYRAQHPTARPVPGPGEVDGVRCLDGDDGATCLVAVGRCVGAARSARVADARAQISAVSILLADLAL